MEAVGRRESGDLLGVVQLKRLDQFVLVVRRVPTTHTIRTSLNSQSINQSINHLVKKWQNAFRYKYKYKAIK